MTDTTPGAGAQDVPLWTDEEIIATYKTVFGGYPEVDILAFIRMTCHLYENLRRAQPANNAAGVWMPVNVGTLSTDNATLAIADNELSIITDAPGEPYKHHIVSWTIPDNYAICRRTDAPQVPQADAQIETAKALNEVAKAAGATLASITWSDEDSNADRYYRGFNDGYDWAEAQRLQ